MKKELPFIAAAVIFFLVFATAFYVLVAFVTWDIDIANWDAGSRFFLAVIWGACLVTTISFYREIRK